jgi:Uma2 family endonuclease
MAGASRNHQRISGNLFNILTSYTADLPCETFSADLKVKAANSFFYPDVMVVCNDDDGDDYYTDKPKIIIEVLSKSTRRTDQTIKLATYKTLPSLQEYVLIEQDHVDIEVFRRSANWFSERYFMGDEVFFESLDLTISVSDIYQRVNNEDMQDYLQQLQQQQAS